MGEAWKTDKVEEREPVDPFAGRKPLDLFVPAPHEMRPSFGGASDSPNASADSREGKDVPAKPPDKELERKPVDPFAGRKPLDLFVPAPHEMRRLPGDELYCARPDGEPCDESHKDEPNPDVPKSFGADAVSEQTDTHARKSCGTAIDENGTKERQDDSRGLGAKAVPRRDRVDETTRSACRPFTRPVGPKSPLLDLASAALLGQDEETRSAALFWAVLKIASSKKTAGSLEKRLGPILDMARAAQEMGAALAVPAPLEYALSMRRELDRLGLEVDVHLKKERVDSSSNVGKSLRSSRGKTENPSSRGRDEEFGFIGVSEDGMRLELGGRRTKSRLARNAYMAERTRLWREKRAERG